MKTKKFPALSDRDGLWRLLVSITIHKLLHVVRDQKRIKRGGQFQELHGLDSSSDSIAAVNQIVSREPSPDFALEVAEQYQEMMHSLEDKELIQLATWKMEGYTNDEQAQHWNSRGHFYSAAAEAMRRILIERARRRKRIRDGGDFERIEMEPEELVAAISEDERLVALSDALDQLAKEDPLVAEIVKLRYFAALTIEQAAEAVGVSLRTANRHWNYAKA